MTIYCNLKGGLGNMLFQIAATIDFSTNIGVECSFPNLMYHLSYLKNEKKFNPNLKDVSHYFEFFKDMNTTPPYRSVPVIRFPFEYRDIKVHDNCIIDGFFQSEKYFKSSRVAILKMFNIRYKEIEKVSIHIRRGDYLNNPNYHTILGKDYYEEAISLFPDKQFLVFSDDLKWCRENFLGERFHFMDQEDDLRQIIAMSLCQHNIIANSSFSWWGAWLNKNETKKVIAPKNWFGPHANLETKDLYCQDWIVI